MSSQHEQSFSQRVYAVVRQIPRGSVATYGQVAQLIGAPRSARFVGYALHSNPQPGVIPCHRVVFKSGALASGFAFGGPDEQRLLLEDEGVHCRLVDGEFKVDLERYQWKG
ncbi:MGMT family protein [Alloscardovia omnicolens]|uniref:MGMT family protein n=1 Tax=Alloscardovia omnicolens TaxID=419015 RepID=UPI003A67FA3B